MDGRKWDLDNAFIDRRWRSLEDEDYLYGYAWVGSQKQGFSPGGRTRRKYDAPASA